MAAVVFTPVLFLTITHKFTRFITIVGKIWQGESLSKNILEKFDSAARYGYISETIWISLI